MIDKKIYVLDTNVLVEDPEAIFSFKDAVLGIPVTVLEELDRIKIESSARGSNARLITRHLDQMRSKGSLADGIELDNGSVIKVLFNMSKSHAHDLGFSIADNKILLNVVYLKEQGHSVVFITKDINARVKANALGIEAQDYLHGLVLVDNYYKGWQEHSVSSNELRQQEPAILKDLVASNLIEINEFVVLASASNPFNQKIYRYRGAGNYKYVESPLVNWPIAARNVHQIMALDLLFDNDIKMISLTGPAGTGKTFLAVLAGLHQVLETQDYLKMMIARSVVPLGHDIGFLPGDVQEKLHGWMQPIYDNVDLITHMIADRKKNEPAYYQQQGFDKNWNEEDSYHTRGSGGGRRQSRGRNHGGNRGSYHKDSSDREFRSLDELVQKRKMSLEAITYMRGRSIPHQFILIDEVQNLTTHEVKTLLSRVGDGSKIILAGDPYQIDVPYLDFSTNGLVVATDRFRGQSLFGTVFMPKSERSELSRLVQELL
ncbi:PhoH family protein [Candidatus Babeliales bacterium]|nr:PhoH family protein [Candidatus Babeliales bacterium]MBP9844348.1 PhoH family protein [Candidatus Babeliales bacterium]